ncbi:MAG: fumarate hydratase [Nitrospinota bacterium]|nr:fumarate hydratase [Nitrospinota bacterium]
MKTVHVDEIAKTVKNLVTSANFDLGKDVVKAFEKGLAEEVSPAGKAVFNALLKNQNIARDNQVPICQDTGYAVFFVELGQDVHIEGGLLNDAIDEGVRQGYKDGYLRKSICDPFTRKNTGDNTPTVVIVDLVKGDKLKIIAAPKGGGSENMARLTMLAPAAGKKGIIDFVVKRCDEAGSNPCPPVIVGVGIGGSAEKCMILAKKALLRHIGEKNPDPELAALEEEILTKVNNLGIGPQGLGGKVFALAVHIEKYPSHIASLPVSVNICCHASRHKEAVL